MLDLSPEEFSKKVEDKVRTLYHNFIYDQQLELDKYKQYNDFILEMHMGKQLSYEFLQGFELPLKLKKQLIFF